MVAKQPRYAQSGRCGASPLQRLGATQPAEVAGIEAPTESRGRDQLAERDSGRRPGRRPGPRGHPGPRQGVRYLPTEWADGDSFRVLFPDGTEHTIRLYGADCLEYHVNDKTDARRLRAQRRHFGISGYKGSTRASVDLAKSFGEAATVEVQGVLQRPFTVHTAFADGRGDGRHKRIYAFVTTADGEDLATRLVTLGLARAHGVYRGSPAGLSRDDYHAALQDAELVAAERHLGVWAYTDWEHILGERHTERLEESELRTATADNRPPEQIDPNTAARDALMRIPGIGEVTANAIIEGRPYSSVDDLLRVHGIGKIRLERLRPWMTLDSDIGRK